MNVDHKDGFYVLMDGGKIVHRSRHLALMEQFLDGYRAGVASVKEVKKIEVNHAKRIEGGLKIMLTDGPIDNPEVVLDIDGIAVVAGHERDWPDVGAAASLIALGWKQLENDNVWHYRIEP